MLSQKRADVKIDVFSIFFSRKKSHKNRIGVDCSPAQGNLITMFFLRKNVNTKLPLWPISLFVLFLLYYAISYCCYYCYCCIVLYHYLYLCCKTLPKLLYCRTINFRTFWDFRFFFNFAQFCGFLYTFTQRYPPSLPFFLFGPLHLFFRIDKGGLICSAVLYVCISWYVCVYVIKVRCSQSEEGHFVFTRSTESLLCFLPSFFWSPPWEARSVSVVHPYKRLKNSPGLVNLPNNSTHWAFPNRGWENQVILSHGSITRNTYDLVTEASDRECKLSGSSLGIGTFLFRESMVVHCHPFFFQSLNWVPLPPPSPQGAAPPRLARLVGFGHPWGALKGNWVSGCPHPQLVCKRFFFTPVPSAVVTLWFPRDTLPSPDPHWVGWWRPLPVGGGLKTEKYLRPSEWEWGWGHKEGKCHDSFDPSILVPPGPPLPRTWVGECVGVGQPQGGPLKRRPFVSQIGILNLIGKLVSPPLPSHRRLPVWEHSESGRVCKSQSLTSTVCLPCERLLFLFTSPAATKHCANGNCRKLSEKTHNTKPAARECARRFLFVFCSFLTRSLFWRPSIHRRHLVALALRPFLFFFVLIVHHCQVESNSPGKDLKCFFLKRDWTKTG